MADINPQVQQFSPSNIAYTPLTRRPQTGATPLSALEAVNTLRGIVNLEKEQALLEPSIAAGKATSEQAITGANTAKLENMRKQQANSTQNLLKLLNQKKPVTDSDIENHVKETILNAGGTPEVLKQALQNLPKGGTDLENRAFIAKHATNSLTAEAQMSSLFPATTMTPAGGAIVSTATGNPVLANQAPGTPTGPYITTTLAPTVAVSPTGGPMQFGGGGVPQTGNLNVRPNVNRQPITPVTNVSQNAPVIQQNAPIAQQNIPLSNAPAQAPSGVTAQSMGQPKQGGTPISYIQGEPYDAFRTRAADVFKLIPAASKALNINDVDAIPNQRYTNEKVQKLLDKPGLNIGAISKAIADKTGGIGLDNDQQEIIKYLEQRIRNESARSNQDQASQRSAFGSFGTNKGALKEIIYKDNGNLAGQELYQRGLLNHAGDVNKPNLPLVNKFNNEYSKAAEPKVVHLIGVIGNKSMDELSKSDKQHLAKEFSGMSDKQIQELFDKKQKLIDLVDGK